LRSSRSEKDTMLTAALILVIIVLVAIFSVQNAVPVTISFFFWRFDASLAIVIFLSVLTGLITGVIVALFLVPKKSSSKTTS
jgi:uncharacterized integral membrane protein